MAENDSSDDISAEDTQRGHPTVVIKDLHVKYHVGGRRPPRLRELFTGTKDESTRGRVIHAVKGVSLTVRQGESVGLVGHNGSGKSTMLRSVAGLLPPTDGEVLSTSQPVLLGVGAALESGLTGRRNVELGCLALGMTKEEALSRVDQIADFADLGDFIDLPLKTYSSGMRARLHFAIATAIEPEILLIDEALSVGDESFRKKSKARIQDLLDDAGTVFLVSHSLSTLAEQCTRVCWIHGGELRMDGDPDEVIDAYRDAS